MRTYLDCIPCFMRQTLQTGRLCGLSDREIKHLLDRVGEHIQDVSMENSPPVMARKLQKIIVGVLGSADPFSAVKASSNLAALEYYDEVKKMVSLSREPLRTAVQAAIAGNIIDYGAVENLDVHAELAGLMQKERLILEREDSASFAFEVFEEDLADARTLLYIGDNAGEIVFDKVFIETISELYPQLEITFVTRGYPILNDVLQEDAHSVGMDKIVSVVSSGTDAPGLVLDTCSKEFLQKFYDADMIISKGQGNYEALSDVCCPTYFLLVAKCEVIAKELGCHIRDIILKKQVC